MKENNPIMNSDPNAFEVIETNEFFVENSQNINGIAELINSQKSTFFKVLNIEVLKRIDNSVFNKLSKECIKDFNLNIFESLVDADKISFLPDFLLNEIDRSILEQIKNEFYLQLNIKHIKKMNKKTIKSFIELEKFRIIKGEIFKNFYESISFSDLEKNHIFLLLDELNIRNKFQYLTGYNFICLDKYIDCEEMEPYLEKLKLVHYNDPNFNKNNIIHYNFDYGILEQKDVINDEKIVIINNEIPKKIEQYLSNENYESLKAYCIKCFRSNNENDSQLMMKTLNDQLNYIKENIYDLIEEFEIRKILLFLSLDQENINQQYKKIKQIIKDMHSIELSDPDEFLTKINKYSEIIKGNSFDIDFLEILAEENLKQIRFVLKKFYNGSDKTAVPNELKYLHIKIIDEYMTIIEKKYLIDKEKIYNDLKKIEGDDSKIKLILFEESLNKYEKLYYDLLIQKVMEQPDLETWINSCSTPIFKFIRNALITVAGIKAASITGSKILTGLSISLGGALILKDVKEEFVKNYFSLKEEEKRIYHLNQKNLPKKRFYIIKKKFIEKWKKIYVPTKKYIKKFFDDKIMHLKEEPRMGFDKFIKNKENIEIESNKFRGNEIEKYYKKIKKLIKIKFREMLLKIKDKYNEKNKSSQPNELIKFFETKQNIILKIVKRKEQYLKEEYPEYKDKSFIQNIKDYASKAKSIGCGIFKSLSNVFSFGLTNNIWSQKSEVENILELLQNLKYEEFQKKLKKIEKEKEDLKYSNLYEDIKCLTKSSHNDFELFNSMKINKKNELKDLEKEKMFFLNKQINPNNLNIQNENEYEINEEQMQNDEIEIDEKSEMTTKLLINEESEIDDSIINTKS